MAYYSNDDRSDDGLGLGYTHNPKSFSSLSLPMLNRSVTMRSSEYEFTKKPLLQPFERNGSIKNLYNSSYESVVSAGSSLKGKVKQLCSIFEKQQQKPSDSRSLPSPTSLPLSKLSISDSATRVSSFPGIFLPGTEDKVVIYFTSLRGIRRTFQDCSYVRMILKGFRIYIDERDISMHSAYKKELLNVLGEKTVTLPQVFIKGKHIGGSDAVRQLHETGELAKLLKGIPIRTVMKACDECGDMRFMPCSNCNGSRKVFDEDEDQVRRCPDCNENGLIQCPICNVS